MARILCAMSGGVDRSVAAAMLLGEGHDVVGAYMKNWINEEGIPGNCPWQQDIVDARAVADTLGIEFRVVNLREEYRARVVSYMLAGYESGITPNPDVMCNREMKFGVFLDYALDQGFEAVATGHYARTRWNQDGTQDILCGLDGNKNQTYFLALLDQQQVSRAVFPIGEMTKSEVRAKAAAVGLPNADKKDSQGICFIGEVKMSDFLAAFVEDRPGDIVGLDGEKLGEHRGLHLFTLGQRKGIGVPSNTPNEAYVVVEKRGESNELVIALDRPETPMLYATRCLLGGLSYVNRRIGEESVVEAQPRYRSAMVRAMVRPLEGRKSEVVFDVPQRALTPGQVCAFYDGEVLLGGGFFETIYYDGSSGERDGHGAVVGAHDIGENLG
ncbi:MAG: tRNA 2-thiouridine(34) synthase MnmA [Verrucomicrobiota bacterium]